MKSHWENIFTNKQPHEVSWTQEIPQISLDLIGNTGLGLDASIIEIGGGDSLLIDHLLKIGYTDLTVLDISERALERYQLRLGENAHKVQWIVSDILDFKPTQSYDIWHDRAAFHFQTAQEDIKRYLKIMEGATNEQAIIGTFSMNGPKKCSGLDITQYDEKILSTLFAQYKMIIQEVKYEDHLTPFKTLQNFIFGRFKKENSLQNSSI